jgi:hypothetical protein
MEHREHHRIDLTAAELERLQELAVQTRSRPTRGPARRSIPSWQVMIRRIGRGELDVIEHNPYELPDGLVEQAEAVEERRREQERIAEQQRRIEAHTAQKDLVRKTPALKLEQMHMPLELEPA